MSAPATAKQVAFIRNLLSERLTSLGVASLEEAVERVHLNVLTVQDAKAVITNLLKYPADPDPSMPSVVAQSTRKGVNSRPDQCVACRGLVPANGGYYFATGTGWGVHHKVGDCLSEEETAAVPLMQAEPGIYGTDDGVYKLYKTRNGHLAAKVLEGSRWQYRTGGVSIVRALLTGGQARLMSHEEAAEFGKNTGVCINCMRTLTDDRSLAVGYGPDCATRNGWPWG